MTPPPRKPQPPTQAQTDLVERAADQSVDQRHAEKLARKGIHGDDKYVKDSWSFQRTLVLAVFAPAPLLAFVGLTLYLRTKSFPSWAFIGGTISFGVGIFLSFFYWRCPRCGVIFLRDSGAGAPLLFWLADPEVCRDCGAKLR